MLHDQIFKELLKVFFRDFMYLFFPDVAARLDFSTVVFLDKEQFTDFPAGRQRTVDLLAQVNTIDGTPELIQIHGEVQAALEAEFGGRMFEYYVLLTMRHRLPILPLVVYLSPGAGGLGWDTWVQSLFGQDIVTFRYGRVGLRELPAETYLKTNNPLAYGLAALMRPTEGGRAKLKADCLKGVVESALDGARKALLQYVIESYLTL